MHDLLLSCDWGTSCFRLRLVNIYHSQVIDEIRSDKGAAAMHRRWEAGKKQDDISIEQFYLQELQQNIQSLSAKASHDLQHTPVVISGMASSAIGMRELPYASLPFALDGSDSHVVCIGPTQACSNKIYLISGISSQRDVMRGEETQMVGLASLHKAVYETENAVCILPGTHSKHIRLHKRSITDFRTYMTGELFHIMTHHSILKDAVSGDGLSDDLSKAQADAFCEGIHDAKRSNLLHDLFSVRINQLFRLLRKEENFCYLSGLLIGTELSDIQEDTGPVILCSGSNVYAFYKLALQEMKKTGQAIFIEASIMDEVVVKGHIQILQHQHG